MSNQADAHAASSDHADHAHGGHGGDHVPHVTPLRIYFGVWAALVVFTVLTVAASRVDFGDGNLIIALVIATTKATLVALFFMHLLHDQKFNAIILVSSLIFLSIFIGMTGSDLFRRGMAEAIDARHPISSTDPWGGMKPIQRAHEHEAAPEHEGAEHAGPGHAGAAEGEHGATPEAAPAAAPTPH